MIPIHSGLSGEARRGYLDFHHALGATQRSSFYHVPDRRLLGVARCLAGHHGRGHTRPHRRPPSRRILRPRPNRGRNWCSPKFCIGRTATGPRRQRQRGCRASRSGDFAFGARQRLGVDCPRADLRPNRLKRSSKPALPSLRSDRPTQDRSIPARLTLRGLFEAPVRPMAGRAEPGCIHGQFHSRRRRHPGHGAVDDLGRSLRQKISPHGKRRSVSASDVWLEHESGSTASAPNRDGAA